MKFHILKDRIKWLQFPVIIWRDKDRFLEVLWGINVSGGKVEPVYLALVHFWGGGGYRCIELGKLLIMFRRRWPYIYIERTNKVEVEE